VTIRSSPIEESAEELYEDAPCGFISTRADGTIIRANRTFERIAGRPRVDLVDRMRFQDLLSPGGRIYHETHYAPLLRMQGEVREIATEIVRPDGSRVAVLVNSVMRTDETGQPLVTRTTVFDATDRRRYEEELLRLRTREQDIALALQRSLLDGQMPHSAALEIAVSYNPALAGTTVGGDWYDAFWTSPERTLGIVIGDVVGRGISAAAAMGQLRSAVRALASTGLGPAELLTALDEYSRRHEIGMMTTLIYAELEIEGRTLRLARAGHPPPVLSAPGEDPQLLWTGQSLPLNPYGLAAPRVQTTHTLAPGATVWLYTDGLIERRNSSRDELEQLRQAVAEHAASDGSLAETVLAIVRSVNDPEQADDSCLIAIRLHT
jgi:sigma-B regulation protein RsbU (phosphoserine phosphatase)